MNKRKFLGTILGAIFWTCCILFFTYAYYEWKSDNTNVVLGIQDLTTKCVKGADVNATDIGPVFNPTDGVKAKFNLSNETANTENLSIELNITSISDNLLVDDFKWMLIKESDYDNTIVEGDFSNFKVGSNTIISSMELEGNSSSLYQFIVYIDGNMKNDSNMQNNSLVSHLEIGSCGLISEANRMINSSTSNFRSTDYLTSITTASFVNYIDTSNVSLDADSNPIQWDMSKNKDNSIIAWLEPTDTEGQYDLYIGSEYLIHATDLSSFFYGMTKLQSINFDNLDTSLVTNMQYIFRECASLTSLNLSSFNTSNVTVMDGMFSNCNKLTSLDLSSFDTSNVTSMGNYNGGSGMFYYCKSLTSLDLTHFDTSKVKTMNYLFNDCISLTHLDVSNWDISNVTNMGKTFAYCSKLTTLDVSNWNTSKVTDMWQMFVGCSSLTTLDVSNWDTSKVTSMSQTFTGCNKLTTLDVSSWNTSNVTNMYGVFDRCSSLTELDVSNWNTSKATTMGTMFGSCSKLTSLDVSNWNTSNVTNMVSMFSSCSKLNNIIGLTKDTLNLDFVTTKVTSLYYMFYGDYNLLELDLSNFNTSNVTTMERMFYNCNNLVNLNLGENFDTSKVTNMNGMFRYCYKLKTTITIRNINTSNYPVMFDNAATEDGAQIIVNYVGDNPTTTDVNESTASLVEAMVATKSATSNVITGCFGDYCSTEETATE